MTWGTKAFHPIHWVHEGTWWVWRPCWWDHNGTIMGPALATGEPLCWTGEAPVMWGVRVHHLAIVPPPQRGVNTFRVRDWSSSNRQPRIALVNEPRHAWTQHIHQSAIPWTSKSSSVTRGLRLRNSQAADRSPGQRCSFSLYFGIEIKLLTFTPERAHESSIVQKSEDLSHHPFNESCYPTASRITADI